MTSIATPPATGEGLYLEVLQFYARQMRLLDEQELADYAGTFTDDCEFATSRMDEPVRTRPGLLDFLVEYHKQFETNPLQRRHYFSMVDVEPSDDGGIRSTCYALVIAVRPGGQPEVTSSSVVHDVLVREQDGLRTRSRRVEID